MNESQFIIPQRVNVDKDYRALDASECTYKLNLRTGLTHGGNNPANENILGTLPVTNAYHDDGDVQIGSAPDISNDSIIYFFYNPDATKHKIVRYFPYLNDRVDLVCQSALLNFQLHHLITSVSIVDDLLYWTDGYEGVPFVDYNPPRKLNLVKATAMSNPWDATKTYYPEMIVGRFGKSWRATDTIVPVVPYPGPGTDTRWELANVGVYTALTFQILDRIKWPPAYAPGPSYDTDLNFPNNLLRNKLFQFSYRYVYDDNEKSVWSPISIVPLPAISESLNGTYNYAVLKDNVINVWVNSGTAEVKEVDIAVREGNHGNWLLAKRWYKYDQDGNLVTGMTNGINIVYLFYNNEVGEGLVQADFNRPYDAVPQISNHEELIEKNRISDEDYTEGFDNVDIDVNFTAISQDAIQSINIVGQSNLWMTTHYHAVLGSNFNNWDSYWGGFIYFGDPSSPGPPQYNSDVRFEPGYTFVVSINNPVAVYTDVGQYQHIGAYSSPLKDVIIGGSAMVYVYPGMTEYQFLDQLAAQLRYVSGTSGVIALHLSPTSQYKSFGTYGQVAVQSNPSADNTTLDFIIETTTTDDSASCVNCNGIVVSVLKILGDQTKLISWKSGSTQPFCFLYKDRAGRMGAANISNSSNALVPLSQAGQQIQQNVIRCETFHIPPMDAEYYCIGYGMNQTESYYLQAVIAQIGFANFSNAYFIDINSYIGPTADTNPHFNVKEYNWELGDRIRFMYIQDTASHWVVPTQVIDVEIIGQYMPQISVDIYKKDQLGNYILDGNGNKIFAPYSSRILVSTFPLTGTGIVSGKCVVEVYRPRKSAETINYYQYSSWLPILNPHTDQRYHSAFKPTGTNQANIPPVWDRDQALNQSCRLTLDGGDSYIYTRLMGTAFPCESMWYSDFFNSETISIGLPNLVNPNMRRQQFISNIRYSQLYLENTQINGLSTCYGADYDQLPQKFGNINGATEVGDILRIIQREKCTSIYIGKVGFKQTPGQSDVVSVSESVIGTKYFHPEGFGTVFSESMVNSLNYTYFFDIYNACECRWSNNGVRQIVGKDSETGWDFGYRTYFRQKSAALLASGIENVNVYSTYEKQYENLIITFVDRVNPLNNETIMFHEPTNSWIGAFSWIPEGYGAIGNILTGCLLGVIYKHNVNPIRNFFYGIQYYSILEVVGHGKMSKDGKYMVVIFDSLEIHTNSSNWSAPNTGDISVKVDNTLMQSRIKSAQFVDREGVKIATFGKDMMTSGVEKLFDLVNGQDLRGEAIKVRLINPDTSEVVVLGLNINMQISE